MKLLVISHEFPPIGGGGANACFFLTKGFVERGNHVTVVTANYAGLQNDEKINGVHIVRVNAKRKNKEHCSFLEMLSFIVKAFPIVKMYAKSDEFDLCQVFFGIPSGVLGFYLKQRYHIPYVIRFGGGDIPGFQERFTKVYKLIAPAIKLIWKHSSLLIANSEGLQKMAYSFYAKKYVDIITNGVDCDFFIPIHNASQTNMINILFVSRLIERKGLQYILPQIKNISEKSKHSIMLTIVGDGPYRETLEELAIQYQVENCVTFVGQKDREHILEYYQNADIFILPSKKEGMPNVVLEAMSCGLPIIMTPCQGSKELIEDNGFVCEEMQFGEKIITLCNDDNLRSTMGEKSRIRASEQFSWEFTVEQYLKRYSQI